MVDLQTPDERLAREVLLCAVEVHRVLGPGFLERVYESAMAHELEANGLAFVRQCKLPIRYKGHALGEMRVDLLVEGKLIVEIKSVESMASLHIAQTLAYLKASCLPLGLLINFNVPVLLRGVRRVILSRT